MNVFVLAGIALAGVVIVAVGVVAAVILSLKPGDVP